MLDELVLELENVGEVAVMVDPMGSHQFEKDLLAERQDGTMGLTSGDEAGTLRLTRGHEAEDVIRDILVLTDRLIHLIVRRDGDGWQR